VISINIKAATGIYWGENRSRVCCFNHQSYSAIAGRK